MVGEEEMNSFFLDKVQYKIANEGLETVIRGINPQEGENFLAICSSGDLPFALSEFGKVVAFDHDENQIKYAQMRKLFLSLGDYKNFSNLSFCLQGLDRNREKERARYFTRKRLKEIQKHIGRVQFTISNFLDLDFQEQFDVLYLSNILGYGFDQTPTKDILGKASQMLKEGGRVYFANGNTLYYTEEPSLFRRMYETNLELDVELTNTAQYDTYDPVYFPKVLRKVRA